MMERISCVLQGLASLSASLTGQASLSVDMTIPKVVQTNPFVGSYEYTPTQETQTILINGLRATDDITINPIPNNYGLITWDGSTITVS